MESKESESSGAVFLKNRSFFESSQSGCPMLILMCMYVREGHDPACRLGLLFFLFFFFFFSLFLFAIQNWRRLGAHLWRQRGPGGCVRGPERAAAAALGRLSAGPRQVCHGGRGRAARAAVGLRELSGAALPPLPAASRPPSARRPPTAPSTPLGPPSSTSADPSV